MEKRKVLITGAGGYLGSETIKIISTDERFETIIGLDIRDKPVYLEGLNFNYIKSDIRSESLTEILKENEIDTVVHLASIVTPGKNSSREFEYEVDVLGTKNVLDCCIKAGVKRFINTSSGAAYGYHKDNAEWIDEDDSIRGNYEFAYSHHKKLVEEMLSEYRENFPGLKQLIFRPGTILGDNTNNQITDLFKKSIVPGVMGAKTPFVIIWDRDMVNCLVKGIVEDAEGIYNVAGDGAVPLEYIAKIQGNYFLPLPSWLLGGVLYSLKKLGLSQYGPEQVNFIRYRPVLSNKKLKEVFGYTPQKSSEEVLKYYLKDKKNVLITGGTSGLGLETANHYLRDGHTVAVTSFEDEKVARQTISDSIIYYQADVNDTEAMKEIIYDFKKKVGRVDVVVANAGISMDKSKVPDFDRGRKVIQTNVIGVLNTFEPAIEIMKSQKSGQLAALSSIAGTIGGLPGMAIYGASKSAVYTLCESLEIDLHEFGIKVTTLAPGFIDTPMTKHLTHAMPFKMTQKRAGEHIYHALSERKGLYLFPLPMKFVSAVLRRLPRKTYKFLMRSNPIGTAD
ncbi:MAG: SDR family NAD(P)-dependent oxidoreductase [Bacteriovoracaceae bacterium]|nr:SDR family NAD(P)-dependent oxidoreductase [Bacteriovoracaceae bacterium]